MEYKTTTKLKQSTLCCRLTLIMTHNFIEFEYKAELECPPLPFPSPPPPSPVTLQRVDENLSVLLPA